MRAPSCPGFLCDEAKAEWRRVAGRLKELGLYTDLDRAALADYCVSVANYQRATKALENAERILVDDFGFRYPNPWVEIQRVALENIHRSMAEFFFKPDFQMRFDEGNNLAELLFWGNGLTW